MKFFLILTALILASCSGVTGRTFNELNSGMTQKATMQKLGKANSVVQKNDMEMHTYTGLYGIKNDHPGCNKCAVVGKCDYYVVYKDGQLIEYGQKNARSNPKSSVTNTFFKN